MTGIRETRFAEHSVQQWWNIQGRGSAGDSDLQTIELTRFNPSRKALGFFREPRPGIVLRSSLLKTRKYGKELT
jgi:hypothetical protein